MAKQNKQRQIQNIFGQIHEHVLKKSCSCIIDGCQETAINSHLLMVHGILNYVAENGKLVELKNRSLYEVFSGNHVTARFKKVGVHEAISLPIFCNHHDTTLFSEIEQKQVDYTNYKHLALYSYRTICGEIRKKEIATEFNNRILASKTLQSLLSASFFSLFESSNIGFQKGIEDLSYFAEELKKDINGTTENYVFKTLEIPLKGIYTASVSTLFSGTEIFQKEKVPIFIFLAIPLENSTRIVMGYHKEHVNPHMPEYIKRWEHAEKSQLGYLLTGILTQIETWGLSPSLYEQLSKEKINQYLDLFSESIAWSEQPPIETINLFEGIF